MLWKSLLPIDGDFRDAPITAMERGLSKAFNEAILAISSCPDGISSMTYPYDINWR
jgi:hypothetical protein